METNTKELRYAVAVAGVAVVGVAAAIAAVAANCGILYECAAEFTYVDRRIRPDFYENDRHNRENAVSEANYCANKMLSDKNLQALAATCANELSLDGEEARRIEEIMRGVKFMVVERPTTNFEVRCRISLSADKPDHLSKALDRCLASYKHFVEEESNARTDKVVYNERIAWVKCKREIEELERKVEAGEAVSAQLEAKRATLAELAEAEARMRKLVEGYGVREMTNVVVHPPKWRLK